MKFGGIALGTPGMKVYGQVGPQPISSRSVSEPNLPRCPQMSANFFSFGRLPFGETCRRYLLLHLQGLPVICTSSPTLSIGHLVTEDRPQAERMVLSGRQRSNHCHHPSV